MPVGEVRRRAMLYFGRAAAPNMALVAREPDRLLFSDPFGDLTVRIDAGRPNTVSVITSHWATEAQEFLQRQVNAIDGLIHYETTSSQPTPEILRLARAYFGQGPQGLGLALSAEHPRSVEFTGGGGQVTVAVEGDGQPRLRVAAREWVQHAEQFVRQLSSEH